MTQFYTRERAENVSQLDVMRDVPVKVLSTARQRE